MKDIVISKPICVVDCNFIQSCRGDSDDVPASWDCLLISSVFGELATKDERERSFLFSRFTEWARRNANRLWIARDWMALLNSHEGSPRNARRIRLRDLVCPANTKKMRQYASHPDNKWQAPLSIPAVREWLDNADKGRALFVSFTDACRKFVGSQGGRPSEKLPHAPEAIRDYVQRFNIANAVVHRSGKGRYGDRCWRKHLQSFPDRLLIARRARLELYYAIRRSLGDSRKFENNWDDIHYAIAASYTGHIATHDQGLIRACEILSPGIRRFPRDSIDQDTA